MLEKEHPAYFETVTFRSIARFTALQLVLLAAVYAVMGAGVAGLSFPVLIVALIPARQYLLPRAFDTWTLSQLDCAEYDE
jgi:boron transporter